MLATPWRISTVHRETDDTFTLELSPLPGVPPHTRFLPGQFNMLYIFGVGEVPISISGDPAETDCLLHTTREVGGVTHAMHRLRRGDSLGVRGPFGTGWPLDAARGRDVILVAGGIGLAPLRPAILHILAHREHYQRVLILYGARSPADILFRRELEQWGGRFDIEVVVSVDRATPGWRGNVGVITPLLRRVPFDRTHAIAMLCGPEIMMRYAVRELQGRGLPDADIYLSMERNMKCGIGLCGHCQFGASFLCKDGPVLPYAALDARLHVPEL